MRFVADVDLEAEGELAVGVKGLRSVCSLATEDELLRDYDEFELGAVPPLGGRRPDRVLLDVSLAGRESLVFEAGEHDESIWLRTSDLLALSHAQVADICRH